MDPAYVLPMSLAELRSERDAALRRIERLRDAVEATQAYLVAVEDDIAALTQGEHATTPEGVR